MPRYTPNPAENTAGALILEKADYAMEITKLSAFIFDKNPDKISHGVQATCKIVTEGEYKGKTINSRLFYHSSGAADMSKKFLMAALGLNPAFKADEERFNSEFGASDWAYDTDDKSLGSGWDVLVGKIIGAAAGEPKLDAASGMMNQNFSWKPYAP